MAQSPHHFRSHPIEPIDSDVDLHYPQQRRELHHAHWSVLSAIALGGVIGSVARYGVGRAFPHHGASFPWGTFAVNVTGCFLIGVLMTVLTELIKPHRLARPFLGVGVLGGYTTFSTYAIDTQQLLTAKAPVTALLYFAGTVTAALAAVWLAVSTTRRLKRESTHVAATDQEYPRSAR